MEQKTKIPDCRKDDDATMENIESVVNTLSSSKASEDWEKISEDWVSLFLDPTILDDHFRSLPLDFENYLQFDSILPEVNNHFSLQDLLADSLLLHSTDDQLSHSDMTLGSSLHVIENLFGKEDSSLQVNIIHPKNDLLKHNISTLPASNLTQVSDNSSLEMEVDLWKNKDANYDLSVMLKQETNAKALSNFECLTSPSVVVIDSETSYLKKLVENALQSSSYLQCEEDKIGSCDVELESTSSSDSIVQVGIPSIVSQSETFGMRHLQSIGNSIKVGLLRRSKDKGINTQHKKNCEVESFRLQNQEVLEEQQSNQKDGHKERTGGNEGNEKQQAWLMCNCKSAQLSKQKKKVYVDELEDKLRIMVANVVDLNTTINHLTAENIKLQRQLGCYCLSPSVCLRPKMPMHVMPIGPYSGPVAGRPMYSSGQMPPIPIPISRINTQIPIHNSKRPKFGATKDRRDKNKNKLRAVGVVSMVIIGFICVVMLFGSLNQGHNGSNNDYTQVENVRVEGSLLTNWNEHLNRLNSIEVNPWEFRSDWLPLEPGEYGPERKGIPSVHTQLAAEKLQFETIKSKGIIKVGFESFVQHLIDGNATLTTSTSPNYFNSRKTLLLIDTKAIPINTSQSFEASIFVLDTNGLVKVDRNLIIQSVMVGNKATKKNSNKKCKSRSKKKKEMKQYIKASSTLQAMKSLPTQTLDNLMSKESKVLKNATVRSFVTDKPLLQNLNSTVEANNLLLPMLRAGSLQQWMLGTLHDPETRFVARKLTKKVKFQLPIDSSKVTPATQETFYSFTPYDAAPTGPLNSWFFSNLSTEPIMCKRNISDNVKEAMHLPIINEERFESLMPFWIAMQPLAYNQLFQKKAHKADTCSVPTLNKLFWAATANTAKAAESQQCLFADRPVLNKTMCTKLFQFDKAANTSSKQASNSKAKNVVELAIKVVRGNPHNVTSTISLHVVPCSQRDPFVVPFLSITPKSSSVKEAQGHNRTDPRVDKTIQEQVHNQNMRHGMLSMVVSVMADLEEYTDNRRKRTKRLSTIFVVVLTNSQKYMTYSCMLPYGEPQPHVVVE